MTGNGGATGTEGTSAAMSTTTTMSTTDATSGGETPREVPLFRRGLRDRLGEPEEAAKMPRSIKRAIAVDEGRKWPIREKGSMRTSRSSSPSSCHHA